MRYFRQTLHPQTTFFKSEEYSKEPLKVTETPQTPQYRNITMPIGSGQFKSWLANLMYINEEKAPSSDSLSSAINVLKGKAQQEGKQYTLFNRVAPAEDGIWLDMADNNWRAIKITKEGWKIEKNPPILFKRYSHQQPLIEPLDPEEGDANKIFDYVNLKQGESTKLAFICSHISYWIPLIAHPSIVVSGPQGSTKSWLFMLLRKISDPSSIELLTIPRDESELAQQLEHHWLTPYDNISYLPTWASDMLCRAITGGGIAVRKLYSDDDDIILQFKRCVLLNGINIAAQKGDLLDRAIIFTLEPLAQNKRKSEADLNKDFNNDKAKIFTGYLNVLSKALSYYPEIKEKFKNLQRLADFNLYGCAIAKALGKTPEDFISAYAEKVTQQTEEALNADPVALAILKFCSKEVKGNIKTTLDGQLKDCWEGQPSDLYVKVSNYAQQLGTDIKSKKWPKSANALTRRINAVSAALKAIGVEIESTPGTPRKININVSELKGEVEEKIVSIHALDVSTFLEMCWKCQNKKPLAYEVTTLKGKHYVCNDCAEPIFNENQSEDA